MKKVLTILFSLTVGIFVILLGAAVFLPSTKRARLDPLPSGTERGEVDVLPTTQESLHPPLRSTKSSFVIDEEAARRLIEGPDDEEPQETERFLPGTKLAVFDTSRPLRVYFRRPLALWGDPLAAATQPATQPAARPGGPTGPESNGQ